MLRRAPTETREAFAAQANSALKAKVEILRTNLTEARGEAERAAGLQQQVTLLEVRLGAQGAGAAAQVACSPLTTRVSGSLILRHVGQALAIHAVALLGQHSVQM